MILHLLGQHEALDTLVAYWIFSAAASSLPDPDATSSKFYIWLFKFLHTISGNLTTAFGSKITAMLAVNAQQKQGE